MTSPSNPLYEPLELTQGESVAWERDIRDYPATEWTASYRLRGILGVGAGLNVTCTADGPKFVASVTAAESAGLAVTTYEWQLWVTRISDANDVRQIERGTVKVNKGFTAGSLSSVDVRSTAQQILDAIDAVMSGKATADQLEYTIETQVGKRQLKRLPMTELIAARTYYANVVAREQQAERLRARGTFFKNLYVRMRGEDA